MSDSINTINVGGVNKLIEDTTARNSLITEVSRLDSRIDGIIAPQEAPSAAEIIDARLGADGITYNTLGDSIRSQVSNISSNLFYETYNNTFEGNIQKEVFEITIGGINPAGSDIPNPKYARTSAYYASKFNFIDLPSDNYYMKMFGFSSLSSTGFIGETPPVRCGQNVLYRNPNWPYYRIHFWKVNDTDMTSSDVSFIQNNLKFSTTITDKTLLVSDAPVDSKLIGEKLWGVKNKKNVLTDSFMVNNAYYSANENPSSDYVYFIGHVDNGVTYRTNTDLRFLSKKRELIAAQFVAGSTYTADYTGDIYITVLKLNLDGVKFYNTEYSEYEVEKYDEVYLNASAFERSIEYYNRDINKNELIGSQLFENEFFNGYVEVNYNYSYFMVMVENGQSYRIGTKCRFLNKNDWTMIGQNLPVDYVYTADYTGVLYVTLYNEDRSGWVLYNTKYNLADVPVYDFGGGVYEEVHDILKNKVWYACGDSFTEGDFSGYSGIYRFVDQPYYGKKMVYPYFIGRRTGCIIKNLASSGSTLATVSGSNNNFINIYTNIGSDADYVTIKYGINDGHRMVPIGTIDSTDTSTFYGAWNTVLNWIIANRPNAKIGIIVSNGLDRDDYADATIAIANKYGLPYLNEWNGEQVPVLIRSGRTDVDPSIIQARTDHWKVSETNLHPNKESHEYESTIIESFLKNL